MPGGGIGCLVVGVVGLVIAYYLLKWFFQILWWASPALFVLALIINWRSVANTGRALLQTLQTNTLRGLLYLVLIVVGFPIFAAYLFLQALGGRKLEEMQQRYGMAPPRQDLREKSEFIDYEELDTRPKQPLKRRQDEEEAL